MALETLFDLGKKGISLVGTDPIGEVCLITGSIMLMNDASLKLSLPITGIGLYHTPRIFLNRIRMSNLVKKHGWKEAVVEKFSEASWCSNTMVIAYSWGAGRYHEFKDTLNKYSISYYIKKQVGEIINSTMKLGKRVSSIFHSSFL